MTFERAFTFHVRGLKQLGKLSNMVTAHQNNDGTQLNK